MEEEIKPIYKNCVTLVLEDISLKVKKIDEIVFLERIRFITSLGDITYKPKKKATRTETINGFKITEDIKEEYTLKQFIEENPFISYLNEEITSGKKVNITLSYAEFTKQYDNGEITYRFMRDYQFSTIYNEDYHKDTKNLEKMENWKIKQEEISLNE